MTRVLMTLDAVGGVWRYALDLAAALRPVGVETAFLGFGPRPGAAQSAEAEALGTLDWNDAPLDWMVGDQARLSDVPGTIAAAVASHRADLVQVNLPSQAAGLKVAVPIVAASHSCVTTWYRAVRRTPLPPIWAWQGRLNAQGLSCADAVVAPSRAHADALRASYGELPNLHVVHNATRVPTGEPADEPFVVASGRWWDDGKGGHALDAAASLCAWPVRMIGPTRGADGQEFSPTWAVLEGELPHDGALSVTRRAGIFASASAYEPFGLAVAEAARLGLPLVLVDIPTFRELWDGAAVLVPRDDTPGFAAALNRLVADPVERRRLGAAAQARSLRFSPDAQAQAMLDLYRGLWKLWASDLATADA